MSDSNDRNGRDRETLAVLVPLEKQRQRPVDLREPSRSGAMAGTELQRAIFDAIVQLVPAVNENTKRTDDTYTQVIVLSKAFNDLADRLTRTRGQMVSAHDLADAAERAEAAAERMEEAVEATNPGVDRKETPSDRVRALDETLQQREDRQDAKKYREQVKTQRRIFIAIVTAVLIAAVLAVLRLTFQVAAEHDRANLAESRQQSPVIIPIPSPPATTEPAILMPAAASASAGPKPGHHP